MGATLFWKKIWQSISGRNLNVSKVEAARVINLVEEELKIGINQYKPYTEESYEKWKNSFKLDNVYILKQFMHRLCRCLNLDSEETWKVFCNYLMYQYYGKVDDIQKIVEIEMYAKNLLESIWLFYSSERIYVIKSLRSILEHYADPNHRYYEEYAAFLNTVTLKEIRSHLFKQLESLINEISPDTHKNCRSLKDWTERNNCELLEMLLSILVTIAIEPLSVVEFTKLLQLFQQHSFGRLPILYETLVAGSGQGFVNVRQAEFAVFLVGLDAFWDNPELWKSHSDEIDQIIANLSINGDSAVIYMGWVALQMTLPVEESEENFTNRYQTFASIAIDKEIFQNLYEMIINPIFEACPVGEQVRNSLFNFLNIVCLKFNVDDLIYTQLGTSELLNELMKVPELAEKCLAGDDEGIKSLYNASVRMFPYDFLSFSTIAETLLKQSYAEQVLGELSHLRTYAENCDCRTPSEESTVSLHECYKPYATDVLVIPAQTTAQYCAYDGKPFLIFNITYSYFTVLYHCMDNFLNRIEKVETPEEYVKQGFRLLIAILKHDKVYAVNDFEIVQCLKWVHLIFAKLIRDHQKHPELLQMCFEIYVLTLDINESEVLHIFSSTHFLPKFLRPEFRTEDFSKTSLISASILLDILIAEGKQRLHNFLLLYLKFVKGALTESRHELQIQVPGMMHLMSVEFIKFWNYQFENEWQKKEIISEFLDLIFFIIQQGKDLDATQLRIHEGCMQLFLGSGEFLKALIKCFASGNIHLDIELSKETNWNDGRMIKYLTSIKMSLSATIMLLKMNREVNKEAPTPFEKTLFYANCNNINIARIIAGYMNHCHDYSIPLIACKLLKNFALEEDLPMLATLEMDYDQVQTMFLERLRDSLDGEEIKVAIIDLICTCVEYQYGMMAAFFNLSNINNTVHSKYGESITEYMMEYLENIKKSTEYLHSPLQVEILHLFYKLWTNGRDGLINNLKKDINFWLTVTDPLFHDLRLSPDTYSQMLTILTLEIFKSRDLNEGLKTVLDKMFMENIDFLISWQSHLLSAVKDSTSDFDGIKTGTSLLVTWKNFVLIVRKYYPEYIKKSENKQILANSCLEGLVSHLNSPTDVRIVWMWLQLYLVLTSEWTTSDYEDPKETCKKMASISKYISQYYHLVGEQCQEVLLSVCLKIIKDLNNFIDDNEECIDCFLDMFAKILDYEYRMLHITENKDIKSDKHTCWLLMLSLSHRFLKMTNIKRRGEWFQQTQFLSKVLHCLGLFIKTEHFLPLTKLVVDILITYAKSPLVNDFLNENLDVFYDSVRPRRDFLIKTFIFTTTIPAELREFWITYGKLIEFINLLLDKLGSFVIQSSFSFLLFHDDVFYHVISLTKQTTDIAALKLISGCLELCHKMLKCKDKWHFQNESTLPNLMISIKETLNASIGIILRPKIVKFYLEKDVQIRHDAIPTSQIVEMINKLIEIIGLSCLCLLHCSPDLLILMGPYKYIPLENNLIINDFHVPRISDEYMDQLTYGSLLCTMHFFCKCLAQIHIKKREANKRPMISASEKHVDFDAIVSFAQPTRGSPYLSIERLRSIQRFASSEISGMSSPWLTKLDPKVMMFSLETLNSLLAEQAYLTVQVKHDFSTMQYIKRELYSELQYFHDFIKKRVKDLQSHRMVSGMMLRKLLNDDECNRNDYIEPSILFRSVLVDDVSEDESDEDNPRNYTQAILSTFQENMKYVNTKPIKIVEEDYLLALSHWFINICHLSP